jgi:hypothetical protein
MRAIVGLMLCATTAYIILCVGGAQINVIPAAAIELQREQQLERVIPPQQPPPSQVKPRVITPKTVAPPRTPAEVTVPEHSAPTAPTLNGPKFVVPNGSGMNSAPGGGGKMITAPDTTIPNAAGALKTLQTFTPHGANASVVTMSRVRSLPTTGVSRVSIGGQNYSVWRHGYRARYHDRWYTCVALSALPAILIAANQFYPFAYTDAPESYCDGLSEDGCQLVWQDVETEEGGVIPQCVAYCPWQQ